ncbi:peroxiredoxin [Arthrobacter psychrolactophilus]|uniref:Peroxiredoxin n=1 Tax=Arthrobacter psychrolactophilus TaxID=92442 RepID=A0A2V5IQ10_9MICC|nr:peroxiredoxin [Arthrobacter psychrolactophilus]PYI38131.1 peroxiredoxin [Arthrobacter psychrolactophilus]
MHDGGTQPGLSVGDIAPDFSLPNQFGEPVSLSGLRGTAVVIMFYPFAFSGICTGELCELRDNIADFAAAGVRLLAVSVDTKYTLRAYARAEGYNFDLLADFWPHGEVAQKYGSFDPVRGMAGRSTFLISAEGRIVDMFHTPTGQARPLERYRKALERL